MKGIILAGGSGTRLYPLTLAASKQLLPVYDKPMVYYPLSMLMLSGIRDILVISTPQDTPAFERLLGDGSNFGASIQYAIQEKPNGLPQAFIIGEKFIGDDSVCLLLGDNIFYGGGMRKRLLDAKEQGKKGKATIFGYYVNDPKRYGIAKFNDKLEVEEVVEKPANPPSNYAITGMYFFDNRCVQFAKNCKPSPRGETEILDVVRQYLTVGDLSINLLGRGFTWFDTGTHDSLLDAAEFVRMIETRQGIQLSCLEEIAYINGWINKDALLRAADKMGHSAYGQHLRNVAEGKIVY